VSPPQVRHAMTMSFVVFSLVVVPSSVVHYYVQYSIALLLYLVQCTVEWTSVLYSMSKSAHVEYFYKQCTLPGIVVLYYCTTSTVQYS